MTGSETVELTVDKTTFVLLIIFGLIALIDFIQLFLAIGTAYRCTKNGRDDGFGLFIYLIGFGFASLIPGLGLHYYIKNLPPKQVIVRQTVQPSVVKIVEQGNPQDVYNQAMQAEYAQQQRQAYAQRQQQPVYNQQQFNQQQALQPQQMTYNQQTMQQLQQKQSKLSRNQQPVYNQQKQQPMQQVLDYEADINQDELSEDNDDNFDSENISEE